LAESALFRAMIETFLVPKLARSPHALVVPFGPAASSAVEHVVRCGQIDPKRVLRGFPHPSGGNGHRKKTFERNATDLRAQIVEFSV